MTQGNPQSALDVQNMVVVVDKNVAGGDGLGRLPSGEVVFVSGAVAGETVEISAPVKSKGRIQATLTNVIQPSPSRIAPSCPELLNGCGGCDAAIIDADQLSQTKRDIVLEQLERIGGIDRSELDTKLSPQVLSVDPTGYRTTHRLHISDEGTVGLLRRASHEVVAIGGCEVASDFLVDRINQLRSALSVGFDSTDLQSLANSEVTVRVSDSSAECTVGFQADLSAAFVERLGTMLGSDATVISRPKRHCSGPGYLDQTVGEQTWRVSPFSFFQSGPQAASLLRHFIQANTAQSSCVMDAYGGVGLLGVAATPDRLCLVEQSSSAIADAAVNLEKHAGSHVIIRAPFESIRPKQIPFICDTLICDPPRVGLGAKGVEAALAMAADLMILIGCDSATFARDVKSLISGGYELSAVQVFDLFPMTWHVEAAAVLRK